MKAFQKIVKNEILRATQGKLDPPQFSYRTGRGVEDAVCALLGDLDGTNNLVHLLFIDFS